MKTKQKLHSFVLAGLLASSSMALAVAPQGPGVVTLTNTVGDLWTAAIGNVPVSGLFTDAYTFSPSATPGSMAWGSVVNTSWFGTANITMLSADLNGTPLLTGTLPLGPVAYNFATLLPSPASGTLTLTIHGANTGGGSYGGDFNVTMAPVPEPTTYAMLLAGMGLVGLLARRRNRVG